MDCENHLFTGDFYYAMSFAAEYMIIAKQISFCYNCIINISIGCAIMKKLELLKGVLKRTYANQIIISFLVFFLVDALLIWLIEPSIKNYGDSLWYCFSVFSTVGFGDIIAKTIIGRILTVLLSVLTIFVVALVTGVVVAFYNDIVSMQYKAVKAEALDKLENLDKLTKEELKALSEQIKTIL